MRRVFSGWLVLVAVGCGNGSVARDVEPKSPTYAQVAGAQTTTALPGASEPLVVDWSPEQRSDLEVVTKDTLAIVSYDERGLRLLKQCSARGSYGFKGVTRKERVIHMKDADEVRANLPLNGLALVGGEIQRGRTVDIALVIVGKKLASRPALARDVLRGDCNGATHYVQALTTGAFAMTTSTGARLESAAQIFSASANASSSSATEQRNRDGDLATCERAHATDDDPPDQCGAILRVELRAIDAPVEKDARLGHTCPKDMVYSEDRCTARPATRVCDRTDVEGCIAGCAASELESCSRLGALSMAGKIPVASLDAASGAMRKGCEGGSGTACLAVGVHLEYPGGGKPDRADLARPYYERGCDLGELRTCNNLGVSLRAGDHGLPKDEPSALTLFRQACNGGLPYGCVNLGTAKRDGVGGPPDAKAAEKAFARARAVGQDVCESGDPEGCAALGGMYQSGNGVPKDPNQARAYFQRGCDLGYASLCAKAKP
jgi:hypothetical protein